MNWEHGGKGVKAGTIADACTQCATVKKRCSPPVDSDDATAATTPPPTPAAPKVKNTRAKSQATTAKSKTTKSAKPSHPMTKSKAKSKSHAKCTSSFILSDA
jgi:hypothetical protein